MRVISGQCKGMTLKANVEIRPTLDRVKVTLFNILQFNILFSGFTECPKNEFHHNCGKQCEEKCNRPIVAEVLQ